MNTERIFSVLGVFVYTLIVGWIEDLIRVNSYSLNYEMFM